MWKSIGNGPSWPRCFRVLGTHPRSYWRHAALSCLQCSRGWLQEHGEAALVLGAVIGIILVYYWGLILVMMALVLVLAAVIYLRAPH